MTNGLIFPQNFLESIAGEPGFEREKFTNVHKNPDAPTSIRLNPFKKAAIKIDGQVPWCAEGFYLDERPSFTFDPLFHAGCYYVQEASSMFADHILKHIRPDCDENIKVLDLCAAPGGKSTLLNSAIGENDLLVANEIIKTRVPILCDSLNRWGKANVVVSNNDPKDFGRLPGFFDVILVDAPCSGSGMFRKDPQAMNEWSEANVNLCHLRQERILADVYPALKEDGYLIYSTCSYSHQENEDILDWLCAEFGMESVRVPINKEWGIVESQSTTKAWGYRFYPDKVKGEGLFAACLKKGETAREVNQPKTKENIKLPAKELDIVTRYIHNSGDFRFFKVTDDWMAIPKQHQPALDLLQKYLYLKKSGVRLGQVMGNDLVPDHELALSVCINKDIVRETELSYEQAIQYLRRDNIDPIPTGKGWSLMCYRGYSLGWAKLLPNRVNNYLPKELRILTQPLKGGVINDVY